MYSLNNYQWIGCTSHRHSTSSHRVHLPESITQQRRDSTVKRPTESEFKQILSFFEGASHIKSTLLFCYAPKLTFIIQLELHLVGKIVLLFRFIIMILSSIPIIHSILFQQKYVVKYGSVAEEYSYKSLSYANLVSFPSPSLAFLLLTHYYMPLKFVS